MSIPIHLEVVGTGSYLPKEIIQNSHFENRPLKKYDVDGNVIETVTTTSDKIIELTGIRERRRAAQEEYPSDMGYQAALAALEMVDIKPNQLEGIILATVTEDTNFPSGASKIQKKLGAKNCFTFDVNNACAGFLTALRIANSLVLTQPGHYLVVGSECLTKMVDYDDLNSTLFGDAAGAFVLSPTTSERGIRATYQRSDPFDGKDRYIYRDLGRFLRMPQGREVFREAIRRMVEGAKDVKNQVGWEKADVYAPHQANIRIIASVEEKVKKDGAEVIKIIEKIGNTSTATVPMAIDYALREGIIKRSTPERMGSRVIGASFGGSLVTETMAIQF